MHPKKGNVYQSRTDGTRWRIVSRSFGYNRHLGADVTTFGLYCQDDDHHMTLTLDDADEWNDLRLVEGGR